MQRAKWTPLRRWVWYFVVIAAVVVLGARVWRIEPGGLWLVGAIVTFAALIVESFVIQGLFFLLAGLAITIRTKHWGAAGVVAALMLVHGHTWAWSWVRPAPEATSLSPASRTKPSLVVLSSNLLFTNLKPERLISQIEELSPDLVVLQEYDPARAHRLGVWLGEHYPHHATWGRSDAFGQAVFSRHEFVGEPVVHTEPEVVGLPQVEFDIDWEGHRVRVLNVHTLPPVTGKYVIKQRRMVRWIGELVEQWGVDPTIDGVIVAGDFNASWSTGHLRELRRAGLHESHDETGRGTGATWFRGMEGIGAVPFGVRLDQIAFGGGLECVASGVGDPIGSDHRPVWAGFELTE